MPPPQEDKLPLQPYHNHKRESEMSNRDTADDSEMEHRRPPSGRDSQYLERARTNLSRKTRAESANSRRVHWEQAGKHPSEHRPNMMTPSAADLKKVQIQQRRIDYVLVYEEKDKSELHSDEDMEAIRMREKFLDALAQQKLKLQEDKVGNKIYVKIHASFERLCKEAEEVKLEMPLQGVRRLCLFIFACIFDLYCLFCQANIIEIN